MEKIKWWKNAVVYQIYPKSFQDSNGDGIGDLQGIIQRLDYIKNLGANVIWLCPIYCSPMEDGGYDISDYYHIDPMFGTDADMDELIQKADANGIKILMDLVINHTSDEHEWFQNALKNPDSKYADYYIFKETDDGNLPNNWRSYFGDSAWTRVEGSNRFYLHAFSKKQPDLNWENEELREEIYHMVNYWLDKGLGGFRIDAICNIKKQLEYGIFQPDGEDGLRYIGDWILNQPGIEEFLKELNERTFKPHNSMTVAEANVPEELLNQFIGEDGFFSMVFDFSYTDVVKRSRDNSRTPMQWSAEKNAGFSVVTAWLEVNENYVRINAEDQENSKESVLNFYRKLIALRKSSKYSSIIVEGEFVPYYTEDVSIIAYLRILGKKELLVIHNYQDKEGIIKLPKGFKERIIGNREPWGNIGEKYQLKPYECIALYKE